MGKDKRPSPEEMLVAAATDIHNDNCTLMARLADPDFDPATGLDCTLNGALEHIMALYERLLLFPQGFVPYEKVDFMVESTNALMSAVERRYRLTSAHRAGQAFRESLSLWHADQPVQAMSQEAYAKQIAEARNRFIAALHEFNCELFRGAIPQPAPASPPPERPKAAGFLPEDRRMLRQIHRASVFGEMPADAQVAGDVRRQQVLYGVSLYRPPTKYDKGFSSYRAADKAITAPQFRDVEGAYSSGERRSLARAIVRESKNPKADPAT